MDYLSAEEIRSTGLLHEVNRQMLHPLGLAAEVDLETGTLRIQDHRYDPEGALFAEELLHQGKVERFRELQQSRHPQRLSRLGFIVQPE